MANTGKAYQAALEFVAPLGTVVCVGIPAYEDKVSFHPTLGINKGVRIIGSAVGTRKDIWEAIEFVQRGAVKPAVEMASLDDLTEIAKNFGKVSELLTSVIMSLNSTQTSGKYVIRLGDEATGQANGA
jgi:propanol-preferring alcohol dehydrogenase